MKEPATQRVSPAYIRDYTPPENKVICQGCGKEMVFFSYMGEVGHNRKEVWYCDNKKCKEFHKFTGHN